MSTKKPKLTVKEAKLVKAKVKGMTHAQAYKAAGYKDTSQEVAVANTHKVLKRPNVQEALQQALEKHNLTPDRIMSVVNDGMSAEKVVIVGKDNDAFADVQPDHSIRLKAAGMAAGFMGLNKTPEGTTNYNFINVQEKDKEEFGL
jgi:phage terminase small subunit